MVAAAVERVVQSPGFWPVARPALPLLLEASAFGGVDGQACRIGFRFRDLS